MASRVAVLLRDEDEVGCVGLGVGPMEKGLGPRASALEQPEPGGWRRAGPHVRPTGPEPSNDNLVFSCLMLARPSPGLGPSLAPRAIARGGGQHDPVGLRRRVFLRGLGSWRGGRAMDRDMSMGGPTTCRYAGT